MQKFNLKRVPIRNLFSIFVWTSYSCALLNTVSTYMLRGTEKNSRSKWFIICCRMTIMSCKNRTKCDWSTVLYAGMPSIHVITPPGPILWRNNLLFLAYKKNVWSRQVWCLQRSIVLLQRQSPHLYFFPGYPECWIQCFPSNQVLFYLVTCSRCTAKPLDISGD